MKTYFAAALLSAGTQAVNIKQSLTALLDDDAAKGYAIAPYDYGVDYLRGNYPGGASLHGTGYGGGVSRHYDDYGNVSYGYEQFYGDPAYGYGPYGTSSYPARELVGYGPGGYGYGADYGFGGLYGFGFGNGRYLQNDIYGVFGDLAYDIYPIDEYYETSSDSASASFGSDSFSQSGSFSDSNDGQHDSDSGSEYEGLYTDDSHYGYYTTIIDSASEASSLSDYSLDERHHDTSSNPETDGDATTEHAHYVDGIYTWHKHTHYQRDHNDLVDGLNSDNDSDHYAIELPEFVKEEKELNHKEKGLLNAVPGQPRASGPGPYVYNPLTGQYYRDPNFGHN